MIEDEDYGSFEGNVFQPRDFDAAEIYSECESQERDDDPSGHCLLFKFEMTSAA